MMALGRFGRHVARSILNSTPIGVASVRCDIVRRGVSGGLAHGQFDGHFIGG